MTSTFELTSAYVIAAGAAATKHTAGGAAVRLSRGKTVLIPGHLARRPYQAPGPAPAYHQCRWHDFWARPRPLRVTQSASRGRPYDYPPRRTRHQL